MLKFSVEKITRSEHKLLIDNLDFMNSALKAIENDAETIDGHATYVVFVEDEDRQEKILRLNKNTKNLRDFDYLMSNFKKRIFEYLEEEGCFIDYLKKFLINEFRFFADDSTLNEIISSYKNDK